MKGGKIEAGAVAVGVVLRRVQGCLKNVGKCVRFSTLGPGQR